tara:strand:+ start:294 stop:1319 length:1026 start_codon:yes stop_codon:yes gene_type:complete
MTDSLKFKKATQLFLVFILIVASSCSKDLVESRNTGSALGTTYSIIFYDSVTRDYQTEIDSVFNAINKSMSTYISTSDISKINAGDSTVVVDAMFKEVFEASKKVYERTKGHFDPTVGVLVNAWGFGPGKQIELDSVKIDSLLAYVGFDKIRLKDDHTIHKSNANIILDFNAIAKGYAVDRVAALLDKKNIKNYLVEVGGELIAKGENKVKNKKYVVGIDNPVANDRSVPVAKVNLEDKALASSGNYRHFREDALTGKKYVHTVDPLTGYTKNSNVIGVSVLANTCAEADAYATAFMAMDLDESMELLLSDDTIDAFIIYIAVNGEIMQFKTDGFVEVMIK